MHPNPDKKNPNYSSDFNIPDYVKYFETTFDPGERDVLTTGETFNPLATAFLAKTAAANITFGFEVFVQLVIAAISNEPCLIS
jgi:hypothetical protein